MFLIVGATGNVGSQVAEGLVARGEQVRVFTRDRNKLVDIANRGGAQVEVVEGDLTQPGSFESAAKGVSTVFLMNGALDPEAFRQILDGAKRQGVRRIVFLSSVLAARPDLQIGLLHKVKEDAIRDAGFEFTSVRATGFMSNIRQWTGSIRAEGVVYNAMGTGKSALIAPEDIAAVAVAALVSPRALGPILEVTGGELLTVPEEVGILANALGRSLRVVDITTEQAADGLAASGLPRPVADAVAASFQAIREGRVVELTTTVRDITGREPIRFADWAAKHAAIVA